MQAPGLILSIAVAATIMAAGPQFIYENPQADLAIRHAMDATYDLNLVEARKTARSLQRTFPDHPVGYLIDAETYWWEAQTDPTRPQIEQEYFSIVDKTVDVGERALKAKKYPDSEIRAYLASAWGSKARFRLTQEGVGLSMVREGQRAHGYAEQVHTADPNNIDILVGIGAYNYFTGKIPSILKPIAWLLGAHGDAVEGLKQLRTVVEKGRYARTEAQIVLFTALMKDGQYKQSFDIVQQLMADHPDNHALYSWITEWYHDQNLHLEGAAYFEKLASSKMKSAPTLAQRALFEKAALESLASRPAVARATLVQIKTIAAPDPALSRLIRAFESTLKN